MERFVHNNDFHNVATKDIRGNWVDLSIAVFSEWNYKNLLFTAKAEGVRSFNYEHLYQPSFIDSNLFWIPGKDLYNFHGQLGISYRF
jgi:hypothetical protein